MHRARASQARVSTVPPRPQSLGRAARLRPSGLRRGSLRSLRFRKTRDGLPSRSSQSERRLEDQVGLEPTVTCVDGLRIRSLGRWGHWSLMGGSGWFRTTCPRVKKPLHRQSGLTLRIHRGDGSRRRAAPVSQSLPCWHRRLPSKSCKRWSYRPLLSWCSRQESNLHQPLIERSHCHCATRA